MFIKATIKKRNIFGAIYKQVSMTDPRPLVFYRLGKRDSEELGTWNQAYNLESLNKN